MGAVAAVPTRTREIIGRVSTNPMWRNYSAAKSVDATRPDYAFYDKLWRGKLKGYELGGLFARPICEITASWVMGDKVGISLQADEQTPATEYTDMVLDRLMASMRSMLQELAVNLYGLGDQYVIVNADGSFSLPSPDTVTVEYDPLDYRKAVKYTITTTFEQATITDEYTAEMRIVSIKWVKGSKVEKFEYPNLIGRIPIVHFANDRGVNEQYGRPIYESMLHLFHRYNTLIEKSLDGVELMGNPIPTFEGMKDPQATFEANSTATDETWTDSDGSTQTRRRIDFDNLPALFIGEGGSFKFASPNNGFTSDVRDMLKLLFLLVLDFTRIPEVIWGNELSSARASAQEQMKTFYQHIQSKRNAIEGRAADTILMTSATGGLHELIDIWLRYRALTDRQIVVAPVRFAWSDLSQQDEALRLQWTQWAHGTKLVTDETALRLSQLVDNPALEVEQAAEEAQAAVDQYDAAIDAALAARDDTAIDANQDEQAA